MFAIVTNCSTCEGKKEIEPEDFCIIYNRTIGDWTYAFLCNDCGRRTVRELETGFKDYLKAGAQLVETEMPDLSYRDENFYNQPALTAADLSYFQKELEKI